jgi:hypothetical protein
MWEAANKLRREADRPSNGRSVKTSLVAQLDDPFKSPGLSSWSDQQPPLVSDALNWEHIWQVL